MGGADLTVAVADCKHFKENQTIPEKFWIVFNVPGFYHTTEYDVDRALFDHGKLSRLWGTSKHQKDTVYAADFGRTVFFTLEEAEAGLNKLIEERRGEVIGEM
jgi:hypothetical protein